MAKIEFKKIKDINYFIETSFAYSAKDSIRNSQFYNEPFSDTITRLKQRLEYLDKTTNTNKRKDRVILFELYFMVPDEIEDKKAFLIDICNSLMDKYGKNNVINGYLHNDEFSYVHNPSGEIIKEEFSDIHIFVVPEIDGNLQGKLFSSKIEMLTLNRIVEKFTVNKYKVSIKKTEIKKLEKENTQLRNIIKGLADLSKGTEFETQVKEIIKRNGEITK